MYCIYVQCTARSVHGIPTPRSAPCREPGAGRRYGPAAEPGVPRKDPKLCRAQGETTCHGKIIGKPWENHRKMVKSPFFYGKTMENHHV